MLDCMKRPASDVHSIIVEIDLLAYIYRLFVLK